MIQLSALLWTMALIFGYIGYTRGWNKEIIATSGIVLGLFALFQFDDVIADLSISLPADQRFLIRAAIFTVIVFFAYQTRALGNNDNNDRDPLQTSVLGALVGFMNGYLVWGSMWYFMHVNNYPLSPYISAPAPGTASANFVESLPLFVLAGGPGGDGNLLAAAMILLFLVVLIVI